MLLQNVGTIPNDKWTKSLRTLRLFVHGYCARAYTHLFTQCATEMSGLLVSLRPERSTSIWQAKLMCVWRTDFQNNIIF